MKWIGCEDFNITNISKISLNFATVKIPEYFCPFPTLTIITGQQNFFNSSRCVTWQNSREKKWFWTIFPLRNLEVFQIAFFSFLIDLITNKARKLEVAESNLIMENFPSSFFVCVCVCVCVCVLIAVSLLLFRVLVFALSYSISLSLSLSLLSLSLSLSLSFFPWLFCWCRTSSCCYVVWFHHLLPLPHAPSIKLKLASLNRG